MEMCTLSDMQDVLVVVGNSSSQAIYLVSIIPLLSQPSLCQMKEYTRKAKSLGGFQHFLPLKFKMRLVLCTR